MDELFYQDQDQVNELVKKFSDAILANKNAEYPFFSEYRTFNYADELSRINFPYEPVQPTDFVSHYATFFENSVNWDSTSVLYNVHPNVNLYAQTASYFAEFANPNFAQDISSGKLLLIELAVIQYFAELAGWVPQEAGGLFTFGGKGTCLYALKIALDKLYPDLRTDGLKGNTVVISNDLGHPCHVEVCNWMGIGEKNCIRLETQNAVLPPEVFRKEFESIVKRGDTLALIFLNGMTTNNHSIDDIKEIASIRDEIVAKYKLPYTPHLHVDSVLGWVYLLASRYDFELNPLNIPADVLRILDDKRDLIANIKYADSFGADFHKTGFASYASSLFMLKNKKPLHNIEDHYTEDDDQEFSQYSPYSYSLELSRSAHGPVSAYAILQTMGVEGFVRILSNHVQAYKYLKETYNSYPNAAVFNYDEESNLMFFIFKPDSTIEITENMDPALVDKIKDFNHGFYRFLVERLKTGRSGVFFSCSRSHKYKGQSFGSLKVYSYNSHFDLSKAKKLVAKIDNLFAEYSQNPNVKSTYNIIDFLDVKGRNK